MSLIPEVFDQMQSVELAIKQIHDAYGDERKKSWGF
jgi:hypothetical protein